MTESAFESDDLVTLGSGTEALARAIASAVDPAARVLHVGAPSRALMDLLDAQACRVTLLLQDEVATDEEGSSHCEQIVRGEFDDADIWEQLADHAFAVAIVGDVLGRVEDPIRIIRSVAPVLDPTGYLVAAVANAAHRAGLSSVGSGATSDAPVPRHVYTLEMIETLMEGSAFTVQQIDAIEVASKLHRDAPSARMRLRKALVSLTTTDNLQATHFIVVAFPAPMSPLTVFREQIRTLMRRCDKVERRLDQLASASDLERDVAAARRQFTQYAGRAARLCEAIDDLSAHLEVLRNESADLRATTAALVEDLTHFKRLVSDTTTNDRALQALRGELQEARRQIELIRGSASWRLTALLRAIARRLGRTTTDTLCPEAENREGRHS